MEVKICSYCKQQKQLDSFYIQKGRSFNRMSYCKCCFNKKCSQRWIQSKIDAVNYKGGKCSRCFLSLKESHYSVFDFHHLNPDEKEFDWNKMRLVSKEKRNKELDKCDLLCANCHRIIHSEDSPDQ